MKVCVDALMEAGTECGKDSEYSVKSNRGRLRFLALVCL